MISRFITVLAGERVIGNVMIQEQTLIQKECMNVKRDKDVTQASRSHGAMRRHIAEWQTRVAEWQTG